MEAAIAERLVARRQPQVAATVAAAGGLQRRLQVWRAAATTADRHNFCPKLLLSEREAL
jgi:hypothetical protein